MFIALITVFGNSTEKNWVLENHRHFCITSHIKCWAFLYVLYTFVALAFQNYDVFPFGKKKKITGREGWRRKPQHAV